MLSSRGLIAGTRRAFLPVAETKVEILATKHSGRERSPSPDWQSVPDQFGFAKADLSSEEIEAMLTNLSVARLRQLGKDNGVEGLSKVKKKADLVHYLTPEFGSNKSALADLTKLANGREAEKEEKKSSKKASAKGTPAKKTASSSTSTGGVIQKAGSGAAGGNKKARKAAKKQAAATEEKSETPSEEAESAADQKERDSIAEAEAAASSSASQAFAQLLQRFSQAAHSGQLGAATVEELTAVLEGYSRRIGKVAAATDAEKKDSTHHIAEGVQTAANGPSSSDASVEAAGSKASEQDTPLAT